MSEPLTSRDEGRLKRVLWPLQPHEDESLLGFVARVAEHNVLESAHTIMSQVGQRYPHRTVGAISSEISIEKLAFVLKIEAEEVRRRSYVHPDGDSDLTFFGTALRPSDIETRYRRFSPGSLACSPYHRALWDCRLIPFCTESWEILIDVCHRCGIRQRWHSASGITFCDACNGDLTAAPAIKVPVEMQSTLMILAGLLHPQSAVQEGALAAMPAPLMRLDAGSVINLLAELLLIVDPASPHRRTKSGWHNDPVRLTNALYKAGNMLLAWPTSFFDQVRASFSGKANGPRDGSLRACSGFIRRITDSQVDERLAKRMRELFDPLRASGPNDGDLPPGNISIKASARALGRGTRIIAEARRQKHLRATISIRSGELVQTLDRNEVEWLAGFIRDRVSPENIAARLGISRHGVEQLICLGVLIPVAHPFIDAMYAGPQFTEATVRAFGAALEERAVPISEIAQPMVLANLLRGVGGKLRPWGPIIEELMNGNIAFAMEDGPGPLTSRLVLDIRAREEIARLCFDRAAYPNFSFEQLMSKTDAAASLNVTAPKAAFLDEHRVGVSRGRSHRVLPLDTVEQLARDYISVQEVTARTGIDYRIFEKAMAKVGHPRDHALGWRRPIAEKLMEQALG